MWVLGVMSGTSLDGVDLALVQFTKMDGTLNFELHNCSTFSYPDHWVKTLKTAHLLNSAELMDLDKAYGNYLAEQIKTYIDNSETKPDIIASHGHTILHQPENRVTLQIGNGPEIFNLTNVPVVCDFRIQDVQLGGQGAPLVPIGDEVLFSNFNYCVNLGGFSNLSFKNGEERIAFDVSPLNIVMNELALKLGKPFDKNGEEARKGKVDEVVLEGLNSIPYYQEKGPKSLGKEWVEKFVFPKLESLNPNDALRTILEHAAFQLGTVLHSKGKVLLTGGGAYNRFFIERLKSFTNTNLVIPDKELVEFKEALIFGLLGYLKWNDKVNVLSSVTGAKHDHSSGVIYK